MAKFSFSSLLASAGVGALATYLLDPEQGRRRRAVLRDKVGGGAATLVRAGTNMDWRRLLGQRGHAGIDFIKTIHIAAPLEQVYGFWSDFENFPHFMRNVRAVYRNRDDTWHWEVAGPLGATVRWDAAVTARVPNEMIAWSTEPNALVQHAGIVHFQPEGEGTRVQVQMTYNPPAGAAGHVVASLFGADPRSEMDEDLLRLKGFFETGKPAHDAAQTSA